MRRRAVAAFTALLLAGASGAAQAGSALRQLDVVAAVDANQATATMIDIVFAYSPQARALLPAASPQWFEQKSSLLSAAAGQIDIVSLQIAPATALHKVKLPERHRRAVEVIAYADFMAPEGQPAGKLTAFGCGRISLQSGAITYASCAGK